MIREFYLIDKLVDKIDEAISLLDKGNTISKLDNITYKLL